MVSNPGQSFRVVVFNSNNNFFYIMFVNEVLVYVCNMDNPYYSGVFPYPICLIFNKSDHFVFCTAVVLKHGIRDQSVPGSSKDEHMFAFTFGEEQHLVDLPICHACSHQHDHREKAMRKNQRIRKAKVITPCRLRGNIRTDRECNTKEYHTRQPYGFKNPDSFAKPGMADDVPICFHP